MADAARFLLAYAKEGADGKLHTYPSNAHETQWDVSDPITDIAAMKSLFPIVIEAAQLLGTDPALVTQLQAAIPKILDFPRTTRNNQTVFGFSAQPDRGVQQRREPRPRAAVPLQPDLRSDAGGLRALQDDVRQPRATSTPTTGRYDPVDAARLGNGVEVAQRAARVDQLATSSTQRPVQPRRRAT